MVKTVEKTDAVFLRVLSMFFSGEWFKSCGRKFNYGLGHLRIMISHFFSFLSKNGYF